MAISESKPKYQVVIRRLKFSKKFLDEPIYKEKILYRLKSAIEYMQCGDQFDNHDIFGINQCIHLATSIALLGSSSKNLQETINYVVAEIINKQPVEEKDPTTIISIVMLYFLLKDYFRLLKEEKDQEANSINVEYLEKHLDRINWMIGMNTMRALDMHPLDTKVSTTIAPDPG